MNTAKRITAILISIILSIPYFSSAFATGSSAELLSIYSDGMLFKQNEPAIIEGYATPGSAITVELKDKNNTVLQNNSAKTSSDGIFTISFNAPEGSFDEYTLTFYENSKVFRSLKNIVFGELWLASGQSNMQYPLAQSATGMTMFAESKKLSPWIRVLMVPAYPSYKNSDTLLPADPQNDITDAVWVNGEDNMIYSMSAVAYFFAEKLMEEISMPVGILNSSLGGSLIRSWLSRAAIDSDPEVKNYLKSINAYYEYREWNEAGQDIYRDMTANYNQKIAPLKNFRLSGMIWYQGESDLMLGNTQYDKQFDLMQRSYTELFNYKEGLLPIIYTQLASYNYSDDGLALSDWNISYNEIQKQESDSRAVITINDIPLTYFPETGLIHPQHKEEVGERMAFSALGLVYGHYDSYSTAVPQKVEFIDNSVFIEFNNTGDGLIASESVIKGFAICGENRIYVNAQAEIVNDNTVRVWSENITAPVAVTYAYGVSNQTANLYASQNGNFALPVSAFKTDLVSDCTYWFEKPWSYCDDEMVWYTENDEFSGYYNTWTAKNASVTVNSDNCLGEGNGLGIKASAKYFSVSPTLSYKTGIKSCVFSDVQADYSDYGAISFLVRNNGTEDVTFEGLRLYDNFISWFTPAIYETLDNTFTIPADGKIYTITLDLNRLYHLNNECSLSYNNSKIDDLSNIEFCFSSKTENSDLSIDSISFVPSYEEPSVRFDVNIKNADNLIELMTGLFLSLISAIASIFN